MTGWRVCRERDEPVTPNPSRDKQVKYLKTSKTRALPAMPEVEASEHPPVSDERRTSRPEQISSETSHMPSKTPYQWADFVVGLELADFVVGFVVGLELAGFVVGAVFSLPSVSSLIA